MTRTCCSIFAIAITASSLLSQKLSMKEREILALQDQRSTDSRKLHDSLKDPETRIRFRACMAFANLQDSSSVAWVLQLLDDSDGQVREAAAFALGQIGSTVAQQGLIHALNRERETNVTAGDL